MNSRTRIKVCGITNAEDAAVAVAAGADAIGVIFAPSPRQVTLDQAAAALASVPLPVARVGVFVDASAEEIAAAISACGLTAVQFSGHESPEDCDAVGVPVLKAIGVGTDFDIQTVGPYRDHAAALLFDTLVAGKAGGTSQTFDWQAVGVVSGRVPLFAAGGLNPQNVGECIAVLHPFAVDVSSGVEASPGKKDHQKVFAFCAAVRAADREALSHE
jgi:phosphoribosylanthranilate isomerase